MLAIWSLIPLPFLNPAWHLEVLSSLTGFPLVKLIWKLVKQSFVYVILIDKLPVAQRRVGKDRQFWNGKWQVDCRVQLFTPLGQFLFFKWVKCLCPLTQGISHASKVMLKILQARFQQYVNRELPDVQAGLEKAEESEIKLPTSAGSWKKQESSRKTYLSALLTMPKLLTVWITRNCGKFWKR